MVKCMECKKKEVDIKKWKLCKSCYQKLLSRGMLQGLPKKTKWEKIKVTKEKSIKDNEKDKYESCATPQKQWDLRNMLKIYLPVQQAIIDKHKREVWLDHKLWIFDMNAGTGYYSKDKLGSSLIILDELYDCLELEFEVYLIESNKKRYLELENNVNRFINLFSEQDEKLYFTQNISIINGDNSKFLTDFCTPEYNKIARYGLLYSDANGMTSFDTIKKMSRYWPNLDILMNVNTTTIKALKSSKLKSHEKYTQDLRSYLNGIQKKFWYITEPERESRWRLTRFFGTNWRKERTTKEFISINSKLGIKRLDIANNLG